MAPQTTSPLATSLPWNLVAEGYVEENITSFEAFAQAALALVPAEGDVVDVAAGPGSLALQAARSARHVVAVDFAARMLERLRVRAAEAGIGNVTVQIADGQALPLPSRRFDAAYSTFGLIFFPDRAAGLREIGRVLRSGGRAVVSSWPPYEEIPAFAALFDALAAEFPGPGMAPPPLATVEDFRDEMEGAGFSSVAIHEHEVMPGRATAAELWRSFARGGAPAALIRNTIGEEAFAAASSSIVARLERALGRDPIELRLRALLGVGRVD